LAQYASVEAVEDDGGDCSEDDGGGSVRTTGVKEGFFYPGICSHMQWIDMNSPDLGIVDGDEHQQLVRST